MLIKKEPLLSTNQTLTCGGIYMLNKTLNLTISSPNYPFQYSDNMECYYLIKVN